MSQKTKITKKDLRHDKFTTTMLLAKDYFLENWIFFVGVLAGVLIVIFGYTYLQDQSSQSDNQASEIYNRAGGLYLNGSYAQAIVDYQMILSEYSSSEFAEQASFNLANTHFALKDYPVAQQAFEDYLNKYSGDDQFFTTSAISGVAACIALSSGTMDPVERYNQVGAKYREAAERFPEFKPAAQYYVDAMKYYALAGNKEAAAEVYSILSEEHKNTQYFNDASLIAGEYNIQL